MKRVWISAAAGAIVGLGFAVAAQAAAPGQQSQSTPKGWSWTLDKDGNRVPKGNRVTKADGSWREEIRQGKCVTIKERTADGAYKVTSDCNKPR